jgi:hypothetical protein
VLRTIITPQYGDHTCLPCTRLLERKFQGFEPAPDF